MCDSVTQMDSCYRYIHLSHVTIVLLSKQGPVEE